ncbi:hypothetical protein DPMN_130985 [Dreissena polymorpha]|uniref:Uncharacterized protein n=1 Tax=Dreissena polymorpha TaxID=45954 RepID=A0A9D4K1P2_DREPO|nr:hypothetical protein DPMN_130985 [Dreissena polymorpha]
MEGDILINGSRISVSGSFASYYKNYALQTTNLVAHEIFKRNFTNFEMNGIFVSPVFSTGVVIIAGRAGTITCPMELRRTASKFEPLFRC